MRKNQQKQILALIHTLHEATAEARQLYEDGNLPSALQILADCRTAAGSIGGFISHLSGEGTATVPLLEEYGGLLAKENPDEFDAIQNQLCKIETSVQTELKPDTLEIVFFPYKASMWDCFESVWLAAKDNPHIDPYVVPVPYYDRLPSGALGEMHYEGHQYPPEVPILDWRAYDLQERRPDAIFIHNPYDGSNHITSLHPDFYSDQLKKYTDLLVYIPYAVSSKDEVAEIFAVLPGVAHANKVILQSETIRQGYLHWFRQSPDLNLTPEERARIEEKFVVLGSPKFDKVITTRREDCSIPEEWQVLAETAQRARKKTILYNTSLNALLQGKEAYLHKVRETLEMFQSRPDILLLWRPHPLMESTLSRMRPWMLEEYKALVAAYRSEGWGIYDDTPDVNRAIALSDAYYGDWSSLVPLYQCSGKPAVLQRWNIGTTEEEQAKAEKRRKQTTWQMCVRGFAIEQDTAYLYNADNDAIFRCDLSTGRTQLEGTLPNEERSGARKGFIFLKQVGNNLVFVPWMAPHIVVYNLESKECRQYSFPAQDKAKMRYCCSYKEKIFLTPLIGSDLVRLDLGRNTVETLPLRPAEATPQDKMISYGLPLLQGHRLFVACRDPKGLIEFDCETEKPIALHPLRNCFTLAFDGSAYWWVNNAGLLHRWNPDTGENTAVHDFAAHYPTPTGNMEYFLACSKGFLFLLPYRYYAARENKAFKVNIASGDVTELKALNIPAATQEDPPPWMLCYCGMSVSEDGSIYTYSNTKNLILRINPESDEIAETPVDIDLDSVFQYFKSYVWEAPEFLLVDYINAVAQCPADAAETKERALSANCTIIQLVQRFFSAGEPDTGLHNQDGTCGKQIVSLLFEELLPEERD